MRWVADENIDVAIVAALRAAGDEVWSVAESVAGITDEDVLAMARDRSAVLLTADKDFGELVVRMRAATCGVVLMRLPGMGSVQRAERLLAGIAEVRDVLGGAFTVVDRSGVRVRRV